MKIAVFSMAVKLIDLLAVFSYLFVHKAVKYGVIFFFLSCTEESGSKSALIYAVNSEMKLLETYRVNVKTNSYLSGTVDEISVAVLKMFQPFMLDEYKPLSVCWDGNCLYRAVSRSSTCFAETQNVVRNYFKQEIL